MRSWLSFGDRNWGLIHIGRDRTWGLHLFIVDSCFWHWGRDDNEYGHILTYWGLGPLGFRV